MAPITITGFGGNGNFSEGAEQHGFHINDAVIRSFGSGPNVGAITIDGTAGISSRSNDGVRVLGIYGGIKSIDADINLTGVGYARSSRGVQAWDQSEIAATGSGNITISGDGGDDSTGNSVGVQFGVSGATVSVNSGDLSITGQGGTNDTADAEDQYGVRIVRAAVIRSTGVGADVGTISITGTGGAGSFDNYGIYMSEANTLITTIDADLVLNGTATGSHDCLYGIRISDRADIRSTGVGPNAGTITMIGQGGDGRNGNHGIRLSNEGTEITSIDGDITLTGTGVAFGHGVRILSDVLIASTGTGPYAAKISIEGTSEEGTGGYSGVRIENNATLRSIDGDITVTASTVAPQSELGLDVLEAVIETLGTADIYLNGTAAGFAPDIGYNGILAPGHNQATFNGNNVEFSPSTVVELTLAGDVAGDTYGQVVVSGDIILANAELDLSIDSSFSLSTR